MARYSGIYLHFEGTTAECDSEQQVRETAFDTDSGMFRYKDTSSEVYYLGGESVWTDIGSGIYYDVDNVKTVYFGHPTGNFISINTRSISDDSFTLGTNGSIYLCGYYWEHRDNDFRLYSASSGSFRIYDGNKLTFGDPDYVDPKWEIYTSGNTLQIRNHVYTYSDMVLSSSYQMYLETWSGDMFLSTFNGGNIILKSSGFASDIKLEATGDIKLEAASDVYTTPWIDYTTSANISGWSAFNTSGIFYKCIGKMVFVEYTIMGTGNGDWTSFKLPFTHGGPRYYTNSFDFTTPQQLFIEFPEGGYAPMIVSIRLASTSSVFWNSGAVKSAGGSFFFQRT